MSKILAVMEPIGTGERGSGIRNCCYPGVVPNDGFWACRFNKGHHLQLETGVDFTYYGGTKISLSSYPS